MQVEAHHHQQHFFQLQVNQKFWFPFHQITSTWFFFKINDFFTIINSFKSTNMIHYVPFVHQEKEQKQKHTG